jgi:hypothetical protein
MFFHERHYKQAGAVLQGKMNACVRLETLCSVPALLSTRKPAGCKHRPLSFQPRNISGIAEGRQPLDHLHAPPSAPWWIALDV